MTRKLSLSLLVLALGLSAVGSGCESGSSASPGSNIPTDANKTSTVDTGDAGRHAVVGDSCAGVATCLAVKYVVYKDSNGTPVATQDQAIANIRKINEVYAQCGIGFEMESYSAVNPADFKLSYGSGALSELDAIRKEFGTDNQLLVVTTGPWGTTKNAWTQSPGGAVYGSILESAVATYSVIIGHELGHYLGLDHVSDQSDLMNAVIYPDSTKFYSSQCQQMHDTIDRYWSKMVR